MAHEKEECPQAGINAYLCWYGAWREPCGPGKEKTNRLNSEKMNFLTEEKLTIVGAAGMIGSNMVQTAIMMGLTPNICAYDPYAPALEGVADVIYNPVYGR